MLFVQTVTVISILVLSKASGQEEEHFQCNDLFEHDATTRGEVTSPFYGKRAEYHNNLWCEYKITAPDGYRIKLTFKDFDVEPEGICRRDQLVVMSKDKDEILWTLCGSHIPKPIISKDGENEFRLLFRTDFLKGGRGFRIEYESGLGLDLCAKGEVLCRNRNCYSPNKKCDGYDDCGDATDEENCGKPVAKPSDDCGRTSIQPITADLSSDRQVGGIEVIPNSWPWIVSLQLARIEPNGHQCGGTLISPQWVVTAAHCVTRTLKPSEMRIALGIHNRFSKTKYQVTRMAEKIIAYPDLEYERILMMDMRHDLALIKLNAPVTYSDGVQPGCLPPSGTELDIGLKCISLGWGETRGSGSDDALKQTVQIVRDGFNCGFNHKTQFCVANDHMGPCSGDSGGPVACKLNEKWYVFGATSIGVPANDGTGLCGTPISKTIYAKISAKIDWIHQTIEKYS